MMKRKKFGLMLMLMFILVFALAIPVFAGGNSNNGKEPVGVRVDFWQGDQTVSGPFYVQHGYYMDPQGGAFGKTNFTLEIDGVEQDGRFIAEIVDGYLHHWTLYNFAEGLPPGQYLFKGTWDDPCFYYNDDCEKKNDLADPPFVVEIVVTVLP
jgi:hypothetical protein